MDREQLQQLSREELEAYCLKLQSKLGLPRKTSKTSSKPPSTDKKAKRANSKPGGAKPGHKPFHRSIAKSADEVIDHSPASCKHCGAAFLGDEAVEIIKVYEQVDIPPILPHVVHHRRLACLCSGCGSRTKANAPSAATRSPFGPGIASLAVYLKTFQLFSYERLQALFADVFGLKISQGGIQNILARSAEAFTPGYEAALSALRVSKAIASDETGMRIEGTNSQQWVFVGKDAVVHHADYTRSGEVIRELMDGHRPDYWLSDRYAAQQNHGKQHQTCLAHLARDLARVLQVGDQKFAKKLKKWFDALFTLSRNMASMTREAIDDQVADLKSAIDKLLRWNDPCPETWKLVRKMKNAKDQLLTFASAPGLVEPTNNESERALRPSVIQRKVTNGYRSKASDDNECKIKTVVDTAKLHGASPFMTIRATLNA